MKKIFLLLFAFVMGGCVPIRQMIPAKNYPGTESSGSHKHPPYADMQGNADWEDPNDYKNLGPDAWKQEMEGIASWYGADFDGKLTANGEVYDMDAMTAAHKTLPLGSVVRVNNLDNGKSAEVRINDRGPYVKGRIIDLSKAAAHAIGMGNNGTAHVRLDLIKLGDPSK